MRYDAFFHRYVPRDSEAVVKSAPVEKVGWTDEARAAAAEARRRGAAGEGKEKPKHTYMVTSAGGFFETYPSREAAMRAAEDARARGQREVRVSKIPKEPKAPNRTATGLPRGAHWDPEPGYHDFPRRTPRDSKAR